MKLNLKDIGYKIKSIRKEMQLTQKQLSEFLSVDQSLISKIEKGERTINDALLDKLSVLFCVEKEDLISSKSVDIKYYIDFRKSNLEGKDLEFISVINKIAIMQNKIDKLLNKKENKLLNKKEKFKKDSNINLIEINTKAINLRNKFGVDASSPIDIFTLVELIDDLTVIFYPLGKNISGLCYKGNSSNIIVLNSNMSVGRQRYSLAHELYHLYFDNSESTISRMNDKSLNEEIANKFASYFLMPHASLSNKVNQVKENDEKLSLKEIVKLERFYGVSHKAMLNRLVEQEEITLEYANSIKDGITDFSARHGFNVSLYRASNNTLVLGYYINMTQELFDKKMISDSEYKKMLHLVFRDDIYNNEYVREAGVSY